MARQLSLEVDDRLFEEESSVSDDDDEEKSLDDIIDAYAGQ